MTNKNISIKEHLKLYLEDAKAELRKVSWPTKNRVAKSTSVIIMLVIFFVVYISGLDYAFSRVIALFMR